MIEAEEQAGPLWGVCLSSRISKQEGIEGTAHGPPGDSRMHTPEPGHPRTEQAVGLAVPGLRASGLPSLRPGGRARAGGGLALETSRGASSHGAVGEMPGWPCVGSGPEPQVETFAPHLPPFLRSPGTHFLRMVSGTERKEKPRFVG